MYNSYKVPVGKKRNDLRNYIGEKFKLSLKENTQVFKWMGIALRGFRCKLANEYILPNANNLSSLKKPPLEYEGIRKEDWKSFVDKILSKNFQSVTNNPKATPKSVTNNPKATPKSVTNNPKAIPKSMTEVSPNSVTNDPTICPKPDKNINTTPLPSPA
ncbi:hypothetical protein CUMW_256760, partial [Citrus unshiu]